jgi:hypothetical protein
MTFGHMRLLVTGQIAQYLTQVPAQRLDRCAA